MSSLAALVLAMAVPAPGTAPSLAPATSPPALASGRAAAPDLLRVHGQLLALDRGFLVFTTGESVRLAPSLRPPAHVALGTAVHIGLDRATKTVAELEFGAAARAGEIDASDLPRGYVVAGVQFRAAGVPVTGAVSEGAQVTLTINVRIPDDTPTSGDVYLATDRSNYGPAEIRMQRIDARRFTVQLLLRGGTTLRYEFTRGSNQSLERDRFGGIVIPRVITARANVATDDAVARWADIQ